MRSLLRDPLIHCLVAGALLFAFHGAWSARDAAVIRLGPDDVRRLSDQWRSQLGRAPTGPELDALIREQVREEVLVREALRLGLAEGDVVIRRRLVQKLRFVTEDVALAEPATDEELVAFYRAETARYREPERVSFSHVFLSSDVRVDAEADARVLLEEADLTSSWRSRGDPFMLRRSYAEVAPREVARDFGAAFAEALVALPAGSWQGPLQSGLGVHLVRVDARIPSQLPSFETLRTRVRADFDAERRARANEQRIAELVAGYRVEIEP